LFLRRVPILAIVNSMITLLVACATYVRLLFVAPLLPSAMFVPDSMFRTLILCQVLALACQLAFAYLTFSTTFRTAGLVRRFLATKPPDK